MSEIYVENGKTYFSVSLAEISEESVGTTLQDIYSSNDELHNFGLDFYKEENGVLIYEINDIEAFQNMVVEVDRAKEEVENILYEEFSDDQRVEIKEVIEQYDMDIDINDIETGNDLLEAIRPEVESYGDLSQVPTEKLDCISMLLNITTSFALDKLDIEKSVLVDTELEKTLFNSDYLFSIIGYILLTNSTSIGMAVYYYSTMAGLAVTPLFGARIVAAVGTILGMVAIFIDSTMYEHPAEDIVYVKGGAIYIGENKIEIDFSNINDISTKFMDIINTNVLVMKMELYRLSQLRDCHLTGAAARLKNYYIESIENLIDNIINYGNNILYRDFEICNYKTTTSIVYVEEGYLGASDIIVSYSETDISVVFTIYSYAIDSSDILRQLANYGESSFFTKQQITELKSELKIHLEKCISDFDFINIVNEYANNNIQCGVNINSYDAGKQKYMSLEYMELLNSKIDTFSCDITDVNFKLVKGSQAFIELDEEISSGWKNDQCVDF